MNGIAPHQLRPGDAFQVRKDDILFVAILENHGMPWRNLSMRLFPYAKMHKFPYFLVAESAQDAIGNLPSQVAIGIRLDGSDWKPVARPLTFLEGCFGHAAMRQGIPWTSQAFVMRNLPGLEPRLNAAPAQARAFGCVKSLCVCFCFM